MKVGFKHSFGDTIECYGRRGFYAWSADYRYGLISQKGDTFAQIGFADLEQDGCTTRLILTEKYRKVFSRKLSDLIQA